VAEPAYAVIQILCDPAQLEAIKAVSNLLIPSRPEYTDDPNVILVHAWADAGAQAALAAMGCTVTVIMSAEDFDKHLDDVFAAIGREDDGPGPVG
jgi:hypothetical protein